MMPPMPKKKSKRGLHHPMRIECGLCDNEVSTRGLHANDVNTRGRQHDRQQRHVCMWACDYEDTDMCAEAGTATMLCARVIATTTICMCARDHDDNDMCARDRNDNDGCVSLR